MSHHDVLDAVHNNTNVILCNHTNTERGFLKYFKQIVSSKLTNVEFLISSYDVDPLNTH